MISISDHPRFAECWDRKAAAYNLLAQKMIEFGIDIKYLREVTNATIEMGKIFQECDDLKERYLYFKLGYAMAKEPEKKLYNVLVRQ